MPYSKIPETTWLIREARSDELNFIYATWLNSYRYDSFIGKACRNSVYFAAYPQVIDLLLLRSKILVAYFAETPSVILGYLVYEPGICHYAFTKEIYQKNGIAMSLFLTAFHTEASRPIHFTHRTFLSEPILQKYESILTYDPFQLYQQLELQGEKQKDG